MKSFISAPFLLPVAAGLALMSFSPVIIDSQSFNNTIVQPEVNIFHLRDCDCYSVIFNESQRKTLAKAEKYNDKSKELLVIKSSWQKQADDAKKSGNDKSSEKFEKKSLKYELKALKTYDKAAIIFAQTYTPVLLTEIGDSTDVREQLALILYKRANIGYYKADSIRKTGNDDINSLRALYSHTYNAVADQENAFGLLHNQSGIDVDRVPSANDLVDKKPVKKDLPALRTTLKYGFENDTCVYRLRFNDLKEKLNLSKEDIDLIAKAVDYENNAKLLFENAQNNGAQADTFRAYIDDAGTTAEREYYDQKAQECEINECAALLKAVKNEIKTGNSLFAIYEKYAINVRKQDNSEGVKFENEAKRLFKISQSYESMADKHYSSVEKYTTLSEGNLIKLTALMYMEDALYAYSGSEEKPVEKPCLANTAVNRHNESPDNINPELQDESDSDSQSKPAAQSEQSSKSEQKDSSACDVNNSQSNNKTAKADTTSKTTSVSKAVSEKTSSAARKVSVSDKGTSVASVWFYTASDQRIKPYKFAKGTIFTVKLGVYKEMPEPVEMTGINKFICQKLNGLVYMRYYAGEYKTLEAAQYALSVARACGYTSSSVAAFTDGKLTSVDKAKIAAQKSSSYSSTIVKELAQLKKPAQATDAAKTEVNNSENAVSTIPEDAQFAVQIASMPELKTAKELKVSELYYEKSGNTYRYFTGLSNSYDIARDNLKILQAGGFKDAFIVNLSDKKADSATPTKSPETRGITYRVQIGAFLSELTPSQTKEFEKIKSAYGLNVEKSGQYTVYSTADKKTRAEAETVKQKLADSGYKETYITVYNNGVKQ